MRNVGRPSRRYRGPGRARWRRCRAGGRPRPGLRDQLVDRRAFERGAAQLLGGSIGAIVRVRRGFADVEQRIGVQRLADEGLDLEVGQRQQLDRLLQLRRHHQRLRLPSRSRRGPSAMV
jgi:hypothetical protein